MQSVHRLAGLRVRSEILETSRSFFRQVGALEPRPRPYAHKLSVYQPHSRQAFYRGINPTVQRNVGCASALGRWLPVFTEKLADRRPIRATQFRIVPPAVDVLRHQVANYPAHENIGRKVLSRP